MDYDLISIGSGSAGRRVAVAMNNHGWKVAIVEKDVDKHFGGTCICSGCIPTKALIEKSHKTNDLNTILEHKNSIVERIRSGTLRHVEERAKIPVIRGAARFVDANTIKVGDKNYSAKYIVIATGSRTFVPPIKGLADVDYKTSKEILELTYIPKKLLVIGGGRIGLEFAQYFNSQGSEVHVFEGMPQLIPGEDTEMADLIQAYLIKKGIHMHVGNFVDEVSKDGDTYLVTLNSGPDVGTYKGDTLLLATGRIPNTHELDVERAGIELERSAIKVNEFMQSSKPHIFAIGDVVGNPMFTNWASFQGGLLVENLKQTNNENWKPLVLPNVPRICFVQPEFAATGMTETQAREKYGDDVVVHRFYNKWLGKSMIVDDWNGMLKAVGLKGSNEILGVHLWGERTGSLIQLVVFAMENDLGWKELAGMVYGHPVLAEGIYSLAAGMKSRI